MARGSVISAKKIAAQFSAIMRNPYFIAANVAPVPPTIFCEHCSRAQAEQQ